MTLDEMYIETAMYTDENIVKTSGDYSGDNLKIINKFKSALNYAYKKICKEKFKLLATENITVINNAINIADLNKAFFKLKDIKDSNGYELNYNLNGDIISLDNGNVVVNYYYMPDDLVNLTDVPLLPEAGVDHKILCYFAAFQYLNIEDDDRASKWINLWNDGFNSIKQPNKIRRVKSVYGGYYD